MKLDDRYTNDDGHAILNGTQALVRLTLEQARRDRAAELHTAGYVTGYRGSPLGGVDSMFGRAARHTDAVDIRLQPGLNEDLAATAVLGTQQVGLYHKPMHDGVFALWYGKGPGVDRSGDIFRHGNLHGASATGGVVLCAGDDHMAKSSTTAHQSEFAFVDAMIPVLHPASIEEIVTYGQFGWAMSRFSGCWTALKLVTDLVDSSETVDLAALRPAIIVPDFEQPPGGRNIRSPDPWIEQERRLHQDKLPAVLAFARANHIDRVALVAAKPRLGIVTTGKSYRDTRAALALLGFSETEAAAIGITIYKVGMVWPLEPSVLTEFVDGLEAILIVEEKRPLIEGQVRDILFDRPASRRPRLNGKSLLPSHGDLSPTVIARAIAHQLTAMGIARDWPSFEHDMLPKAPVTRVPYFCSGCPHNISTQVPAGSHAMAGIGCHGMAQFMGRDTDTFVQMGGEGVNWIGQAGFVETNHVFQNLGDGTYFHSGVLAVRAAIAAKVNITYKILFNDAVAMTGGQPIDGELSPQSISHQMRAEGVKRIAIVTDDPAKYVDQPAFAAGATIHARTDLNLVQRELREIPGTTVIVYDQMCATEKRRRRKRGLMPNAVERVFINPLVCEGCGDCSVKSNCLSVIPLDTEWGRKRQIDQSSCNQDMSCIEGFCPSFVTVKGTLRKADKRSLPTLDVALPEPALPSLDHPYSALIVGIGGTGVVTIGAILAQAALIDGNASATLDQTGLAQKGGQVISHLKIAATADAIDTVKVQPGAADVVIAADIVGATSSNGLSVLGRQSQVIVNTETTVTGAFTANRDFAIPGDELLAMLSDRAVATPIAATALARRLLGDAIGANMVLTGFAYQCGLIPVAVASIEAAIRLNGAAVDMNLAAFQIGRIAAHNPDILEMDKKITRSAANLDDIVTKRAAFLGDYQNAEYAGRYTAFISQIRSASGSPELVETVAQNLFRLMAYKDEYEVARLHRDQTARTRILDQFEHGATLTYHLAPPLFSKRDPVTGHLRKRRFGAWMSTAFAVLAPMKRLRGTPLDVFGYSAERCTERQLITQYKDAVIRALERDGVDHAIVVAKSASDIRGFGHVKEASIARARAVWDTTASTELVPA